MGTGFDRPIKNAQEWVEKSEGLRNGGLATKEIVYSELTTGAIATVVIFTVTGDVRVKVFAVCSESLVVAASGTIEVGVVGATAALLAQLIASGLTVGLVWTDASPDEIQAEPGKFIIANGADIKQKITTGAVTDGTLKYYCEWEALSDGANVVAA
jgi:hypothetical protein